MKYCSRSLLKFNSGLFTDNIEKSFTRCYASSGIGMWDKIINDEIKHKIEAYWSPRITNQQPSVMSERPKNYYVLSMFPYPSGALHMGHVRVYTISDSISRFHKLKGKNVLHPMGWDAFGLPAENAALEHRISPSAWTNTNIAKMKSQLVRMACDFDWSREIRTCDSSYYKWTQLLFLKLFKKSLAYQKESFVNWDPVDKTVLADEQVDHDGISWRSGAKIEKKLLKQWFIRTTAFAESLYEDLDDPSLKEWRDVTKIQKHWIGEPSGTSIDFELVTKDTSGLPRVLSLWTDRAHFIHHTKFVAVSKENFLVKGESIDQKEPFWRLLDAKAVNPFTSEEIPIYFTNMVEFPLTRDNFVGIPGACESAGGFCDNVGIAYSPLTASDEEIKEKRKEIMDKARELGIGGYKVSERLRDWLISRQRYWGTPIPIIHCPSCGPCPVPEAELPVLLPELKEEKYEVQNLKDSSKSWLKTACPECGGEATRESDTMDTFVDSSWYFLRYLDANNEEEMFSRDKAREFLPVDLYIGGKEHAALHLYYARFVNHFLHSEGLVPTREPFKQLLVQGMVMGRTFKLPNGGKYLKPDEVEQVGKKWVERSTKQPIIVAWEKMSKSRFNGVDPDDMFDRYGVDATRLIILADFAPVSNRNWSENAFVGVLNWQKRLWLTVCKFIEMRQSMNIEDIGNVKDKVKLEEENDYLRNSRNYYLKTVNFNMLDTQQMSIGITKMQGLTGRIRRVSLPCIRHSREYERALATQIIMLAPLAPHFASELWAGFCSAKYHLIDDDESIRLDKDVLEQQWPEIDMDYELKLNIFINGCLKDHVRVPRRILDNATEDDAVRLASESELYQKCIADREVISYRFHSEPSCDGEIYFNLTRAECKIENAA